MHISRNRSRSLELAATPPPRHSPFAPVIAAAHFAFVTKVSTTASWNEATTSAVETSGLFRTWLITEVFNP